MKTIPIALQMYTLRNETDRDFIGTLKKVSELGYDGVEFAGYGNLSTKELKGIIDELNLRAAASHIPVTDLEDQLEKVIYDQQVLQCNTIVCPYLPPESREEKDYIDLVKLLNRTGELCKQQGITLCYHNHDFELQPLSDGRSALQTILEETNPEWVKAEFDIYWLTFAGEDPVQWLKKYKNRTPIVHLKDMTTDGKKAFAELGTGGVNLDSVIDQGSSSDVEWWVIEQDECKGDPIESVSVSLNYLKNVLQHRST